ncbi:MAG: hypothetical protein KJO31_01515 [Gammaproteobacteria bacterium]|nr:hypothetical protein [Gammaproteobacteria bacterium]
MKNSQLLLVVLLASVSLNAQEVEESAEPATEDTVVAAADETAEPNGDGIDQPKALSGMSILGNEEAPKALVIIPWKSSELGDDITLSDSLDDRAKPVDKEVFLRELRFYEIRSSE